MNIIISKMEIKKYLSKIGLHFNNFICPKLKGRTGLANMELLDMLRVNKISF
jgi:hypothetical protein